MQNNQNLVEDPAGSVERNYSAWAVLAGIVGFFIAFTWHPMKTPGHVLFPYSSSISPTNLAILTIGKLINNPLIVALLGAILLFEILRGKLRNWNLVAAAYMVGGCLGATLYQIIIRLAESGR